MQLEVDVAIIGAGTAGIAAAHEVKKVTDSFVIINGGQYGTTCARVGCMPSKTLLQVANNFHRLKNLKGLTSTLVNTAKNFEKIEKSKVMEFVRQLRDRFVNSSIADFEHEFSAHNIHGYADFVAPDIVRVGATQIRASKGIIIATGSQPVVLEKWKNLHPFFLTSNEVFELETLPKSIAVIGLGILGLEFAQSFARLGVKVVGIEQSDCIGGLTDPEVSKRAAQLFSREFEIVLSQRAELSQNNNQVLVEAGGKKWRVEKVFLSTGRSPALSTLGLEKIGLLSDSNKVLKFNRETTQVGEYRIFVAGDAEGEHTLLHEAALDGKIAGYNSVRIRPEYFSRPAHLVIGFTSPGIAVCGLSYHEAVAQGMVSGKADFSNVGRAIVMQEDVGLLHLYAERTTGRVLGAELVAPGAEHLAHLLAWSVQRHSTIDELLQLPYYHPTLEEGIRTAAKNARTQLAIHHSASFNSYETTQHQTAV